MGDKFKNKNENHKDCGCGHKTCDCGDDCDCTKEDNCGCDCNHDKNKGEHCHEHKHGDKTHCHSHHHNKEQHHDCGCGNKGCDCDDDCECINEDNCGCHCHNQPSKEEYEQLFEVLKNALEEGNKQLEKARVEIAENQHLAYTYKKDLERYKERNANIKEDCENGAIEKVALPLITILDQFESALLATPSTPERKGFEMIYAGLKKAVSDIGIAEIQALGEAFDTNIHNAVSKTGVSKKEQDGTVTAVYQKGYKLTKTNKIIRYAMVEIGEYIK